MGRYVCFILILTTSFTILKCSKKTVNPDEKPENIQLILHGSDMEVVERGIDADSDVDGILICWRKPEDQDIDYVEIFRGNSEQNEFDLIVKVFLPDTLHVDTKVPFHQRQFYYALSVSEEGIKSSSSDTLSYMLLEKPMDLTPSGITNETGPILKWRDPNQAHEYIIKILEAGADDVVWISKIASNYEEVLSVVYNADGHAKALELQRGKDYIWRVDVVGGQTNSGSESQWTPLNIR